MLGEREGFGASVISRKTSRPLAKCEEGESTCCAFHHPFPPSLPCASRLFPWHVLGRTQLPPLFALALQWLPINLLADSDFRVTLPMTFIFLKMSFWRWGPIVNNRACQSEGWMHGLLSCQGFVTHWQPLGPVTCPWPAATLEASRLGDIPTVYFSIMSRVAKDWEALTSRNKSLCVSLTPKGEQVLGNRSELLCYNSWTVRGLHL